MQAIAKLVKIGFMLDSSALYIFAGLPGSGKTTLSQMLASHVRAVHLRIDTLEQTLRDLGFPVVADEGYQLAYRLAADNLRLGLSVVADSCNTVACTRQAWLDVATAAGVPSQQLEIVCSDVLEHRQRVEARPITVPGLKTTSWQEVLERETEAWTQPRLRLDTAGQTVAQSFQHLLAALAGAASPDA